MIFKKNEYRAYKKIIGMCAGVYHDTAGVTCEIVLFYGGGGGGGEVALLTAFIRCRVLPRFYLRCFDKNATRD